MLSGVAIIATLHRLGRDGLAYVDPHVPAGASMGVIKDVFKKIRSLVSPFVREDPTSPNERLAEGGGVGHFVYSCAAEMICLGCGSRLFRSWRRLRPAPGGRP